LYVIRASNDRLRDYVYRLRHQVYCLELGYKFDQENGREIDMDDRRSVHVLVMQHDGRAIGTGRVILPELGVPLPTERVLDSVGAAQMAKLPPRTTAEISRFTLLPKWRADKLASRLLMQGLVDIGIDYGVTDAIAVMQPAFVRLFQRFGIQFRPLGGLIKHHGIRQPCWIPVQELIDAVGSTHAVAL
jgi:N-acyl-L-homoserine lactone synthetase